MLEYIILGLLMEGDMSGYEMKKTIDMSVGLFYKASFGSLYPALKRLADKKWVSVTEEEGSTKNKKIYSLLPAGRSSFLLWLKEPIEHSRNEFLLKVFFYDYLDEPTRNFRLGEYQEKLNQEIGRLQAVEEVVEGELSQIPNPEKHYFRVSVLSYGKHFFNMEKEYIERLLKGAASNHE
jgi:DNA-binding PadR family transcriptional regulator